MNKRQKDEAGSRRRSRRGPRTIMHRAAAAAACIFFIVAGFASPARAAEGERILSYMSDITVHENGSMTVTETIKVIALGQQIKRGIYRDFPTRYRDNYGNKHLVGFEILGITRDGEEEPYHTESLSNGVRVYVGSADVFLDQGEYTYGITYRTNRQLGFFDETDELYWNVTGNGWLFPIDHAGCVVRLPGGVPMDTVMVDGYTGRQGSKQQDFESWITEEGAVNFEATRELRPYEGLTIVVSWPKGYVHEPGPKEKAEYFIEDNIGVLLAAFGLFAVLFYYMIAWLLVGRDPEKGAIVPQFEPPENLSPAAVRFISRMGFDNACVSAAFINLGVKGYVNISGESSVYSVSYRPGAKNALSLEEEEVANTIQSLQHLVLTDDNHTTVSGLITQMRETLKTLYEKKYFSTNSIYVLPGVLMSAVTGGLALLASEFRSIPVYVVLAVMLFLMILFYHLLKKPTIKGRRVMDRIEGLKMYLSVAEKDRLNMMNPPKETPELFEKFLPYALALGVENKWCERFSGILSAAAVDGTPAYRPHWYAGHYSSMSNLTNSLGSGFTGSISSASTPPGSSSGGGGGGCSGGGGGGGGGGGW